MNSEESGYALPTRPAELVGRLPRKVEICSTDAQYLLGIVMLFLVGGSIYCGWRIFNLLEQSHQRDALRSEGREMIGVVTKLTESRSGDSFVYYTFVVEGGSFSNKAEIPNGHGISLLESDKIPVLFLPSNPAINHPEAWEWSPLMGLGSILFVIFSMGVGSVALTFLLRERKLLREGTAVPGVVIGCIRKDREFRVEYEFRTEEGISVTGNSGSPDQVETGSRIWILYLPKNTRRNHLYPFSDYRIAE